MTHLEGGVAGSVPKGSLVKSVDDYADFATAVATIPAGSTLHLPAGTYPAVALTSYNKDLVG